MRVYSNYYYYYYYNNKYKSNTTRIKKSNLTVMEVIKKI
jgi:hypothetical protein